MMGSELRLELLLPQQMSRLAVSCLTTVPQIKFHFLVVTDPNRTMTHDGFRVDLGSSATATNDTTNGVLFHNSTAHPLHFLIDLSLTPPKQSQF